MRYVNLLLCLLLFLFAIVQYNDPDGLFWSVMYLVPAIFAGVATFRPWLLCSGLALGLLIVAAVGWAAGVVYLWPQTPEFWQQEVWWETETAREGMGMMIAAATLVFVLLTALAARSQRRRARGQPG